MYFSPAFIRLMLTLFQLTVATCALCLVWDAPFWKQLALLGLLVVHSLAETARASFDTALEKKRR